MQMIFGSRTGLVEKADLGELYPWPSGRRWVRGMMVTTLDGAARGADDASGSISSKADKVIFNETRRLADVLLIGASTMRIERYRPLKAKPEHQEERAAAGLRSAPVVVMVSASLDIPWDEPIFRESEFTPIVVTSETADADAIAQAREHCEVIVLPGSKVDVLSVLDVLTERGWNRIVCEGGPSLLAELAAQNLLDEADISISPLIVGGGQILTGDGFDPPDRYRLEHIIEDDGFLFNRYISSSVDSEE
ncbi:MAG: pyrimidine reductase family protein [Actinobacteria bacterium]|nr:pyrimidine reductase family protein [Actinomycetota bacterium]